MLVLVGALLVSYIFPLGYFFFLKNGHKEDEEYQKDCWKTLLRGLLLGFPVFGFSFACNIIFALLTKDRSFPVLEALFSAFVLKALSEELMKYLNAGKTMKKNHEKVSYLDLLSFTCISAIGFELMEAVFYLIESNAGQILVRGITNMHASFGLIMGSIIGKGYKKGRKNPVPLGIFIPTLIHGFYDLCLAKAFEGADWTLLAVPIAAACLILNIYFIFFIRKTRKDPYYIDPLFPENG